MIAANPTECPYCGGYKSKSARWCSWCQTKGYVLYRAASRAAARGPRVYARWTRLTAHDRAAYMRRPMT